MILFYCFVFRKTLVVQISSENKEEQKSKYYIPVCLKKVLCYTKSTTDEHNREHVK